MTSSLTSRFLLSRRSDVSARVRASGRGAGTIKGGEAAVKVVNQKGAGDQKSRASRTDAQSVAKCAELAKHDASANQQRQKISSPRRQEGLAETTTGRVACDDSRSTGSNARRSNNRELSTRDSNTTPNTSEPKNGLKLVSAKRETEEEGAKELVVLQSPDNVKRTDARPVTMEKELAKRRLPVPAPNRNTLPQRSAKARPAGLPGQLNRGGKALIARRRSDADLPGLAASARRSPLIPDVADVHFSWYKEHDLKKLYPISPLLCVQESFAWLAAAAVLTSIHLFVFGPTFFGFVDDPVQHISSLSVRGSIIAALVAVVYHYLIEHTKELKMNGFRLVLAKGIFRRLHGSMTLGAIGQIYVKQKPIDMIFNLYRVQILIPMTPDDSLSLFRGLTREQAYHLQGFLAREMNRQVFLSGDAVKAEEELRTMAAMQEANEGSDEDEVAQQRERSPRSRKTTGNQAGRRSNKTRMSRA